MNGTPTDTIEKVKEEISKHSCNGNNANDEIKIGFNAIEKQAMQPQLGVPRLYQDQLNMIGSKTIPTGQSGSKMQRLCWKL